MESPSIEAPSVEVPSMEAPSLPDRIATKTAKRYNRGIEFEYRETDYNMAEFYEEFQNRLPRTVIVSQGFCGEIIEDIFDRGQVIRIYAISKQRRVVAKFQYTSHSMLISIPESYSEKLCIVKQNRKRGKPKEMSSILKENSLPLTVQFPKDQTITVGNQTVSTNNIPCLELKQVFDEVYFLGNFITDGVMNPDVIPVPLYLSHLRVSLVTGIKGQSEEKWTNYQTNLDREASCIEFDLDFGNPNIAEYDPAAVHSEGIYTYVEPVEYSNIVKLVHKTPLRSFDNFKVHTEEGPGVYEEIDNTARDIYTEKQSEKKREKKQPPRKPGVYEEVDKTARDKHTEKQSEQKKLHDLGVYEEIDKTRDVHKEQQSEKKQPHKPSMYEAIDNAVKDVHTEKQSEQKQPHKPGVYKEIDKTERDEHKEQQREQKQPLKQLTHKEELEAAIRSSKFQEHCAESTKDVKQTFTSFKPQLPKSAAPPLVVKPKSKTTDSALNQHTERLLQSTPAVPERKPIPGQNKSTMPPANAPYSNVLPRSRISPTMHVAKEIEQKPKEDVSAARDVDNCDDVAKLTVDEVSEYMKKLKLEKYIEDFKTQLIDGRMLIGLDKDMLKEEFGMRGIEVLRLLNFAKDGHVPK